MTPNVIKAKIKRLKSRYPNLDFWLNHKNDEFKKIAMMNKQWLEAEVEKLQNLLNDQESRNTQGEITEED